jgi:hypothetical protein
MAGVGRGLVLDGHWGIGSVGFGKGVEGGGKTVYSFVALIAESIAQET